MILPYLVALALVEPSRAATELKCPTKVQLTPYEYLVESDETHPLQLFLEKPVDPNEPPDHGARFRLEIRLCTSPGGAAIASNSAEIQLIHYKRSPSATQAEIRSRADLGGHGYEVVFEQSITPASPDSFFIDGLAQGRYVFFLSWRRATAAPPTTWWYVKRMTLGSGPSTAAQPSRSRSNEG